MADVDVDRPIDHGFAVHVETVEQLLSGEYPPRGAHQGLQQLELGRRQLDRSAVEGHLVLFGVEHQGTVGKNRFLFGHGPGPPQDCLDPLHQFPWAEGLDHVVVRPEGEPQHPVDLLFAGGQHQDRHIGEPAQLAADLPAVDPGQHHVEDDEGRRTPLRQFQGLSPVMDDRRGEAFPLQVGADQGRRVAVVFDDENRTGELEAGSWTLSE